MNDIEILLDLIIIIIIIIFGVAIYYNFNKIFITEPPPPPPEPTIPPPEPTNPPPPEPTNPPPPSETTKSRPLETTKPRPPETTKPRPPETTKPRPPETTKQPPDTGICKAEAPFGTIPTLPIPNGVILDINNFDKKNINVQEFVKGRISTSNNIITTTLQPDDGNGENGDSKDSSGKQRNEISVKNTNFIVKDGQTGTWGCYFKINNDIKNWNSGYYHIMQIKYNLPNGNPDKIPVQPPFTISIKDDKINVRDENGKHYPIQSVCSTVNRWIPMSVKMTNTKDGKIEYNVNGKTGSFTFSQNEGKMELYFKAGQYRAYPNPITTTTSSSYKDISFILNK
jgi:hypothetical protein